MSLPSGYSSCDEYFKDVMSFLKSNELLINNSNVEILSKGILNKFPKSWIDYVSKLSLEDLFQLPSVDDDCPESLSKFYQELSSVTPQFVGKHSNASREETLEDLTIIPRLSVKKQHEILELSQIIHDETTKCGIKCVIDLGSGLGYLCQLLHSKYSLHILGIEADEKRVNAAKLRQEKHHKLSNDFVKYVPHFITQQSQEFLQKCFDENFGENKDFLIIGLHACADLSVNALKLFISMDHCRGLIIMPCCYHKMELNDQSDCEESDQTFVNFPLSNALRRNSLGFFKRPFMRLACQRSQGAWESSFKNNHGSRTFHLMCRAVLEVYAVRENGRLVKHGKRKLFNKTLAENDDFEVFLTEALSNFKVKKSTNTNKTRQPTFERSYQNEVEKKDVHNLDSTVPSTSNDLDISSRTLFPHNFYKSSELNYPSIELFQLDRKKILNIWNDLKPLDFKLATFYTLLQDSLQNVCENVVLVDKLAYLQEQSIPLRSYDYIKITDETISPRCLALVAEK